MNHRKIFAIIVAFLFGLGFVNASAANAAETFCAVQGTDAEDNIVITESDCTVNLGRGSDTVLVTGSNVTVNGESGSDTITLRDTGSVNGGTGADRINVDNGFANVVDGGPGVDRVQSDELDTVE